MKLTDVARASLSELRGDYGIFILDRDQLPWSVHSPEAKAVHAISLDQAPSLTTPCMSPPGMPCNSGKNTPAG